MKYKLFSLLISLPFLVNAQVLLEQSIDTLLLSDGTEVMVGNTDNCRQCFYYLPINLRLSVNKQGTPEVSFLTWKNDDESEIIGGIFHFLIVWGLAFTQEEELQRQIQASDSLGVLMGPITVETFEEYVLIEGKNELTTYLNNNNNRKTSIATTPGAKMAMSFSFDESEINEVLQVINDTETIDTKLSLPFTFDTKSTISSRFVKNNYTLSLPLQNIINNVKIK